MIGIGRLCLKTAGRDAGLKCVIIDILDDKHVLIDGETRRRKCNILHLEPLKDTIKIKKGASHDEVKKEFEKLGLKSRETKPKPKKEKPVRKKKLKKQEEKEKTKKKPKEEKSKKRPEQKKEESLEEKAGLKEKDKENEKKT